jgi:hypothetical protein
MGDLNHVAYQADDFDRGVLVGQHRNLVCGATARDSIAV